MCLDFFVSNANLYTVNLDTATELRFGGKNNMVCLRNLYIDFMCHSSLWVMGHYPIYFPVVCFQAIYFTFFVLIKYNLFILVICIYVSSLTVKMYSTRSIWLGSKWPGSKWDNAKLQTPLDLFFPKSELFNH